MGNQVEDLRSEVDVNVSGKTASELLARFKTSAIQKDANRLSLKDKEEECT